MLHVAFFSYAHADDDHSGGKLADFCRWLEADVRALTGNHAFTIFLDRDAIEWGNRWKSMIDGGLGESAFLIPIISPTYLNRPECRREFLQFLAKERRAIGGNVAASNDGLVLPLLYLELPPNYNDDIAKEVAARQWLDIRTLSFRAKRLRSNANDQLVRTMAERLVALFEKFKNAAIGNCGAEPLTSHRTESLVASFKRASEPLLLWPATMPNGCWLDRSELLQLFEACNAESPSAHVIVGPPGAGKSALLARLAHQCRDAGLAVLGIKADFLPETLSTVGELSEHVLGHPGDLAEEVRWLAKSRKVVVIIDQLDALADLVDLKSARLDLLLNLIQHLRGQSNVHLFCSSRTYELRHDLRLNGLTAEGDRPSLAIVELQPLSREQISSQLASAGINGAQWPQTYFEFLAIPYHLRAFLEHVATVAESGSGVPEQSVFSSIHSIHELHWQHSVLCAGNSSNRIAVLERLAERISDTEALRQPIGLFDEFGATVTELEQAGWLHSQASSIGFAHQTQYEFLLARRFAANPDGFIRHVLGREHGLFVRPLVWHTLNYARRANPHGYLQLLGGLLNSVTRRHLRMLLIDFLGQISDPQEQEVVWVTRFLNDPATYPLMSFRLWKQQGWYVALSAHVLPALMGQPTDQCWPVARILQNAWEFGSERNRELLRDHWAYREELSYLLWTVVADSTSFDDELVKWLCWAASKIELSPWAVRHAVDQVAKSLPELAPQILAAGLNRRLDAKLAESDPPASQDNGDPDDAELLVHRITYRARDRIRRELENNEWHDIAKLAKQVPSTFLRALWPWFKRAIENCDEGFRSRLNTFRHERDYGTWFHREVGRVGHHYPLPHAIFAAVQELAKTNAAAFADFVAENLGYNSTAIQRLMALGLLECTSTLPTLCFQFLTTDSRRFFLGNSQNGMSDAANLVLAASPHWTAEQLVEFQRTVLEWNPYRANEELRQAEGDYSCEHRARLLRALPVITQTPESVALIAANEASLQAFERSVTNQRSWTGIKSPIDAPSMETMSDDDIVALFDRLHDATGTHDPNDWLLGGSEQASHQFREFAKVEPERAAAIIRRFRPGVHERPAGYGLDALAEAKFDPVVICTLVRELDQKGFSKPEFRDDVGQALQSVAIAGKGLPDDLCQSLSQWLLEDEISETPVQDNQNENEGAEGPTSIIWNSPRSITIPHRWYWIGTALKLGLCLTEPPRTADWLSILARCAERPFPNDVWMTWLWDFTACYLPDRAAVAPVLATVLKRNPDVLSSDAGIVALAHFSNWLDDATRHELLAQLECVGWKRSQQAKGELVGVWALRDDDERCWEMIEAWLSAPPDDSVSESCRIGLAFAAAEMWTDSSWRAEAASILCRLTSVSSRSVRTAILHAFGEDGCLRTDSATRDFLASLARDFDFRSIGDPYAMSRRLVDFLPHEPELILRVCQRLITPSKQAANDSNFQYGMSSAYLIAIALTLHRHPDNTIRTESLTLFEDLLALDAYHASQSLTELDQRPIPTQKTRIE